MKKQEYNKRLIRLLASMIVLVAEVGIYMVFWYQWISPVTGVWYWRKGNWVIAALYIALVLFFATMYGGFRLGDLEKGNVIYSQILSMLIVNMITYIQVALLAYRFPPIPIFVALLLCDVVIITVWAFAYDAIYHHLFQPRKLLLVYGNEQSLRLLEKINKRKDRYVVAQIIKMESGIECIMEKIEYYDGIMLCDIATA
ncbi:MAG: sugar transferase, partial [Hungatella sp.]